jgi:hypothetical protein
MRQQTLPAQRDPAAEEALHDSLALRSFAGADAMSGRPGCRWQTSQDNG